MKDSDIERVERVIREADWLNLAALAREVGDVEQTYLHQVKAGRMRLRPDVAARVAEAFARGGLALKRR